MPIITISRGSYTKGKAVAEKLAGKLGYTCISRDEIIDSLEEFHFEEVKLVRNLKDAFSVLDSIPNGKNRFVSAMEAALLERFMAGNCIYHGLAGHHFVQNISHVLKVRIVADTETRVAEEMARWGISADKARTMLKNDDEERRKWGMYLYGIDIQDSEQHNLVIRIGHLSVDDAVDIIAKTVQTPVFQETDGSRQKCADLGLSHIVRYALFDFPNAKVSAKDGNVTVTVKVPKEQRDDIRERIESTLADIDAVKSHTIDIEPYF